MRERRRQAAGCAMLTIVALLTFAASPSAAAPPDCPPYEVIGARGSGQDEVDRELGMGPEVHDFFVSLRPLIGSDVVRGYGIEYPAVNVKSLSGVGAFLRIGFLGKYTGSVRDGTKDAEARILARHRQCGKATRFILAGYSQGAQALGDLLEDKRDIRKLVAAAAFFGDPYFNADSESSRGSYDPASYGLLGVRSEWDASVRSSVFSYCHWHDAICNNSVRHHVFGTDTDVVVRSFDDRKGRLAAHGTPAYRLIARGGQGDAGSAAREVARALGFIPSPLPYVGPLDVVFVIDSTGSMTDEIEEVKEDVIALVESIKAINPDYRLALVDYKDVPEEDSEYQARLDLDFSTDVSLFNRGVEALEAIGGGDTPESVYSGLMTALNLDWRAGAKKIVVQIGDAPAKDPEPGTGLTLRAVQAKALAVDPATIDTIQTGDDEEAKESFGAIASATGGQYVQLPTPGSDSLVPAITNEIRRNTAAPAALLSAPSYAVAGVRVTLSAGASRDVGEAIAGYDWDFNGDGVFETSTVSPVVGYTYPAPFTGTVVVRVRSVSGLATLATAPISVLAPPSRRPKPPSHLRKQLGRSKLTLTWTAAAKGGAPRWFSVLGRRRHAMARVAVNGSARRDRKGKRRVFSVTIRGLKPGGTYRFSVSAGNDAGESKPAGPVTVRVGQAREHRHR